MTKTDKIITILKDFMEMIASKSDIEIEGISSYQDANAYIREFNISEKDLKAFAEKIIEVCKNGI